MLLADLHILNINSVSEPTLLLCDLDIVNTGHPFAHFTLLLSVFLEGPVFKTICPIPLAILVVVLVEELNGLWIE